MTDFSTTWGPSAGPAQWRQLGAVFSHYRPCGAAPGPHGSQLVTLLTCGFPASPVACVQDPRPTRAALLSTGAGRLHTGQPLDPSPQGLGRPAESTSYPLPGCHPQPRGWTRPCGDTCLKGPEGPAWQDVRGWWQPAVASGLPFGCSVAWPQGDRSSRVVAEGPSHSGGRD